MNLLLSIDQEEEAGIFDFFLDGIVPVQVYKM